MFRSIANLVAAAALALAGPVSAQSSVDPNAPYEPQQEWSASSGSSEYESVDAGSQDTATPGVQSSTPIQPEASSAMTPAPAASTIPQDDVLSAAEGVFGKGTEGLAGMIEKILKEQGQPTAYIAGREAGGAFVLGVRYGSGTMRHNIEGDRAVYWTGPSIGFDAGADANKVFVLVYNLHDSQDLFKRYAAAEGRAYVVGGFTASYLRRGDVVLIPVRLGVGLRLGVNGGYLKFSEKSKWMPF